MWRRLRCAVQGFAPLRRPEKTATEIKQRRSGHNEDESGSCLL
jgi:hypothetical protein